MVSTPELTNQGLH